MYLKRRHNSSTWEAIPPEASSWPILPTIATMISDGAVSFVRSDRPAGRICFWEDYEITHTNIRRSKYIHTRTSQLHTHTQTRTQTHACTHGVTRKRKRKRLHTKNTRAHKHTHARTHARTRTHTHTHTRKYTNKHNNNSKNKQTTNALFSRHPSR